RAIPRRHPRADPRRRRRAGPLHAAPPLARDGQPRARRRVPGDPAGVARGPHRAAGAHQPPPREVHPRAGGAVRGGARRDRTHAPTAATYGVDASVPPEERYRIVGRIAAGGMAEIYLSRMRSNTGAEREVVLKRLLPELQADHEFVQMFHDEAMIASQLSHPNI